MEEFKSKGGIRAAMCHEIVEECIQRRQKTNQANEKASGIVEDLLEKDQLLDEIISLRGEQQHKEDQEEKKKQQSQEEASNLLNQAVSNGESNNKKNP